MSLIFAVDSDKRQSAMLASLLRTHVDADLVQSGSASEGLAILQGRIPDLILTSSLLSPRDEAALANHLRELGDNAAHVHTLTIPVIAAPPAPSRKKPQGVLGGLRREKETRSTGCDPAVFAREVALYLERALERRTATPDGEALPQVHMAFIEPVAVVLPEPVDPDLDAIAVPAAEAHEPAADVPATPQVAAAGTPTFGTEEAFELALPLEQVLRRAAQRDEPTVVVENDRSPVPFASSTMPFAHDAAEIAGLSAADLAALSAPPLIGRPPDAIRAPEPPTPVVDMGVCEELDAIERRFAAGGMAEAIPLAPETARHEPSSATDWLDTSAPAWPWVDDQAAAPLEDVLLTARGPQPEMRPQPVVQPPPEPEPAPTLDFEALELIGAAALQAGLDALGTLHQDSPAAATSAVEPAIAPAPQDSAEAAPVFRRTRERGTRAAQPKPPAQKASRPAQDEWGMFDPAQCGPAALFDEDDWEDEPDPPRPAVRPRGVVY